jgi:hypothetical protein
MSSILQFDGATFDPELDGPRLTTQLARVLDLMLDGRARTLRHIADTIGASEASVSARLRDLRKSRFGAYVVERKRVAGGLHTYRIIVGQLGLFE